MKNVLKLIVLFFALNVVAQRTDKSIQALYGATFQNATEVTTATKIPVFDTNLKLNTWINPSVFTNGFVQLQGTGTLNYLPKFAGSIAIGLSQVYDNGTNVGIGTTTPSARLEVSGRISQVGTGESVFIGEGAGENDDLTGNRNVFVGFQAGQANSTGLGNVAQGYRSLWSNTTGAGNIAQGYNALPANTIGNNNVAIGLISMQANVSGNENVAIGAGSLAQNTTGGLNVGIGINSITSNTTGANNLAIGSYSLASNTTGSLNTVIGSSALSDNTIGYHNTILGYDTGGGITTGNSNTIIGANVTGLAATLCNNIIIADGEGLQRIRVLNNGNVGIGTTTPSERLEVIGNIEASNGFILTDTQNTNRYKITIVNGVLTTTLIP